MGWRFTAESLKGFLFSCFFCVLCVCLLIRSEFFSIALNLDSKDLFCDKGSNAFTCLLTNSYLCSVQPGAKWSFVPSSLLLQQMEIWVKFRPSNQGRFRMPQNTNLAVFTNIVQREGGRGVKPMVKRCRISAKQAGQERAMGRQRHSNSLKIASKTSNRLKDIKIASKTSKPLQRHQNRLSQDLVRFTAIW